jgi:chorismate synthase
MHALELTTAGESHGPRLTAIVTGLPAGLEVDRAWLDAQLARRQGGYGRSPRQQIEADVVEVSAGLRHGRTMGSPVALHLRNRDHESSWSAAMSPWPTDELQGNWRDRPIHVPRPGHADLGGIARHDFAQDGLRPVLERASARETAARVAAGALAQQLLASVGVRVRGFVRATGAAVSDAPTPPEHDAAWTALDTSELRTFDADADARMVAEVDAAREAKDTLGGVVEVVAWGLPPGLGGYVTNAERLDGRLARAALSVHAMKSVAIGDGADTGTMRGCARRAVPGERGARRPGHGRDAAHEPRRWHRGRHDERRAGGRPHLHEAAADAHAAARHRRPVDRRGRDGARRAQRHVRDRRRCHRARVRDRVRAGDRPS